MNSPEQPDPHTTRWQNRPTPTASRPVGNGVTTNQKFVLYLTAMILVFIAVVTLIGRLT